jgi:hypothetical protein
MPAKFKSPINEVEAKTELALPEVIHPKPKILMLDVPDDVYEAVALKGFNVRKGSFGKPYKVRKDGGFQPVIGKAELPNYTEQDVVVIDLNVPSYDSGPQGDKHRPDSESDLWAKCDKGFIDPRVRGMWQVRERFDRILDGGGVFIVFADAKQKQELQFAKLSRGYMNELYDIEPFHGDIWDFLSACQNLCVRHDHGEEMMPCKSANSLGKLVARHLQGGSFTCTIYGGSWQGHDWIDLCENKFSEAVGIAWLRQEKGTVIVVPQLDNKAAFIESLVAEVLPELAPHLFPSIVSGKWVHHIEYELTKVVELQNTKEEVERRAKSELEELNKEIEKERGIHGWLHDLLTGTDSVLVEAAKKALGSLGFSQVVDIDDERDAEGKSRREDLQIRDASPTLIVDLKGIGGYPGDADVLQADKHAAIRMREENRTDIVGLSIINHQRHLPPLDRENAMPFRQELLDAAEERTLGLLTAWDLYRFVRNATRHSWKAEQILPLFYSKGRIQVVPIHYKFIGVVAKAWTDKFGIVLDNSELRVGDRIAIEFPIEFEEIQVDSIRANDQNVDVAKAGDPTGLLWAASAPKLKEGMRVFLVRQ